MSRNETLAKPKNSPTKRKIKASAKPEHTDLNELQIEGPVYFAAFGLVLVYGWGLFQAFPATFAVSFTCIILCCEFIKPALGRLFKESDHSLEKGVFILAAAICSVVGCFAGMLKGA